MKKTIKKCTPLCEVPHNYRAHFRCPGRPDRPHPIKLILVRFGVEVDQFWLALDGFPDLPEKLEDFILMLEGKKWMPFPLEVHLWRKLFYIFGDYWGSPDRPERHLPFDCTC